MEVLEYLWVLIWILEFSWFFLSFLEIGDDIDTKVSKEVAGSNSPKKIEFSVVIPQVGNTKSNKFFVIMKTGAFQMGKTSVHPKKKSDNVQKTYSKPTLEVSCVKSIWRWAKWSQGLGSCPRPTFSHLYNSGPFLLVTMRHVPETSPSFNLNNFSKIYPSVLTEYIGQFFLCWEILYKTFFCKLLFDIFLFWTLLLAFFNSPLLSLQRFSLLVNYEG